ncbi:MULTISPECIES: hypothetical protein [unclassified Streptomyces]|uniref:hypothetical protein n=1 Tax=unclassified Streptomyces TaxID=2593676 RepID=UPI002254324B|nr:MULTISPECIES: hypothetical protein [unclassified Streptomyces]MCX5063831.1 hypothetical protein [Streptomyces sp. NBC_00452]
MRYAWRRSLRPLQAESSARTDAFDGGWDVGSPVRLDEMRDVPVVVVLGERGAGKSVALEQEHGLLRDQGAEAAPWLHLGRDVADTASAGSTLQQHLHGQGDGPRYVLLDGLDEGLSDIPGLDRVLLLQLRALSEPQRERLRLRITCRTTRWPEALESGLRGLWPDADQVTLMTLEPLTRHDVESAAWQRGLDGAAFAEEVSGRGLAALAEQPVTLIPLLDAQAEGEALPKTVAEAYNQACRRLCTESWPQGFVQRQERPAVDHLLEVARWAAAALQFSRVPALADREPAREGELHLDSLVDPALPGLVPQLECRRHELLHLTESSLLTPVGQRRWVFAHRSYQEHLAAQYLREHIAPAVRSELLWAGSGSARHIVPEQEEIAARLAADDLELFEDLLVHDPRVLLLADLPSLSADYRQQAAQALLDEAPDEGFDRIDFALLKRLTHPSLFAQLTPFLVRDADPDQTYLALWIAAQCQPAQLTPALLSFAEDITLPTRLRSFALHAIAEGTVHGDEVVARMRALAADAKTGVAEAALDHLWPQHLPLTEYFDLLPAQRSFTYRPELEKAMDLISAEHADEALAWCRTALEDQTPKSLIATALLARCIHIISHPGLGSPVSREEQAGRALVALAAYPELSHTSDARTPLEYLHDSLNAVPVLRRRLADYVLRHSSQEHVLELTFTTPEVGLFPDEDLLYWAERWPDLPQEMRRTAQPLFSRRQRPDDARLHEAIEQARQADNELRNATAWWDAPPPEWQLRRQKGEQEQRRRNTFDEDQFTAALEAVHTAAPDQVRAAWRTVLGHIYRTHDGRPSDGSFHLTAVAAAPSCPPMDSALHAKLFHAALHVLATAPAWKPHDVSAWGTEWTDVPELTAAGFVSADAWQATAPATDIERWTGWALALATMTPPAQEADLHHSLFKRCARHAGHAFEAALATCLDRLESYRLTDLVRFLHTLDAMDALAVVRAWAAACDRSDAAWAAVTVTLSGLGDTSALAQVKDTVAAGPPHEGAEPDPGRWITAACTLMSYPDLPESWPPIRQAFEDPDLCRAVIDRMIIGGSDRWPAGVAELDVDDLVDLYTRLCEREELHRPRTEHEPGVAYRITREDTLHDLADALPQLIASKGTPQAADHLGQLAASTSRHTSWLRRLARRTARQAAQQQSRPLPAHQLKKLAADHSLRVITDEAQLLDVVMEAVDRVQETLSGPNGMAILLWNRAAAADYNAMWPTWEEDFSDLVMGLLKIHLGGRRIILNREVQVDRPGAGGGRTDIHIQAADPSHDTEPFTVVIEAKGCWNRSLPTALAEQLVARYLRRPRTAGIFLVGLFDCDQWHSERRQHCSPGHTPQQIEHEQQELAAQQDALVRARVLDCRPPGAQTD